MVGMKLGQALVHRSIANMVSNWDLWGMSTINHPLEQLQFEHAVVCRHFGCGDVKAADLSWLREVRVVFRRTKEARWGT